MIDGVSIIIPTYNGGSVFKSCLDKIRTQDYPGEIQLVVIDSGSTDDTLETAVTAGAVVKRIDKENFHHSKTRNEALALAVHNKVVFLVQDAIPVSNDWLTRLSASLEQEGFAAAYARQIPHDDADVYARYEVESHNDYLGREAKVQSISSPEDFDRLSYDEALRLIRFDNVCAIYWKELLEKNPFPDVAFAEDMAWAHSMLLQGYKILFLPEIAVSHSHNRPPEYRFRRAIADSRSCAQILGVVRDDFSFFKAKDLLALDQSIQRYVKQVQKEITAGCGNGDNEKKLIQTVIEMVKSIPVAQKIRHIVFNALKPARIINKAKYQIIEQSLKQHICFTLSMLTEKYQLTAKQELIECLKQISSSTIGNVYGEVYSSYMLEGNVPEEIERLIRPYMSGV